MRAVVYSVCFGDTRLFCQLGRVGTAAHLDGRDGLDGSVDAREHAPDMQKMKKARRPRRIV